MGGGFTHTADGAIENLGHIAKFSGGVWSPLPDNGLNGYVDAITFIGNDLYAAGYFTETVDGAVQNLNAIAVLSLPPLANYPLFLPLVSR